MFTAGKITAQDVHDWVLDPGLVVSWHASATSLAKIHQAPVSAVPASHQQTRHIRNFREHAARDVEMSRLCIAAWDIPGQCDLRAMTYVFTAHLRRHDTYHSWFEYTDDGCIIRHTISDPTDISLKPTTYGQMTPTQWQDHLLTTPDPLQWDCFRFAIIQYPDHFTCCVVSDHLRIDAMVIGVVFMEVNQMYSDLITGRPPTVLAAAGSYANYCVRQQHYTSGLTLESAEIGRWIDFFENNDGALPDCPISLGDGSGACDIMAVRLLDEQQTIQFESACTAAGARFSGGVLACTALADYALVGTQTYYGLIVTDTRSGPEDFVTTGWFAGFVPVTVPVDASSFSKTVNSAQASFDSNVDLADVPFELVLELAPWLRMPNQRIRLLFHTDVGVGPLSAIGSSQLDTLNARLFHDGGVPARFDLRVNRFDGVTDAVVFFPNNPVARESVSKYLAMLKNIYVRIAENRDAAPTPPRGDSASLCA